MILFTIDDDSGVEYSTYSITPKDKDKSDFKYFEMRWRKEELGKRMYDKVAQLKKKFISSFS